MHVYMYILTSLRRLNPYPFRALQQSPTGAASIEQADRSIDR